MTAPSLKEVYDPSILMWTELCADCYAAFIKWRDAPNPANWNNPKIADNPALLGFLQACRAAGPSPQEWRDTEDAAATWKLLNELERAVLAAIDSRHIVTPQDIANRVVISRQRASVVARQLKTLGLVRIKSLPKQTSYELTGQGKAVLDSSQAMP